MGVRRIKETPREKQKKRKVKLNIKDMVESNPYTNIGDLIEYMESLEHDQK